MDLLLNLKSRPFSCNKSHYRNGMRTKENRRWADSIQEQLAEPENKEKILKFKNNLSKYPLFHVSLFFLHPAAKFYTQSNDVHIKTMDLSNIEKGLIDLLFDARYNDRNTDSGALILNIDNNDKRSICLESYKGISENNESEIWIYIESVQDLKLVRDRLNRVKLRHEYNQELLSTPRGDKD